MNGSQPATDLTTVLAGDHRELDRLRDKGVFGLPGEDPVVTEVASEVVGTESIDDIETLVIETTNSLAFIRISVTPWVALPILEICAAGMDESVFASKAS